MCTLTDNYANIFDIPGYNFMVYITEKIDFKLREDRSVFKENILESLFIEFKTVKDTVVVNWYFIRPTHSRLNEFEEHYEELLGKIKKENKLYNLMGDFNMLKMNQTTSTHNDFINQLFSSSFYPHITKPNKNNTQKCDTLIDNILTNRQ